MLEDVITCGECKYFEYRFMLHGTRVTYCKYHHKQYLGDLTENDFCSKAELDIKKPFNQNICDRKSFAATVADSNCIDDCDMECPYRKGE